MDQRNDAESAVMWSLHRTAVIQRELSLKTELLIDGSIHVLTLPIGHELWAVTDWDRGYKRLK